MSNSESTPSLSRVSFVLVVLLLITTVGYRIAASHYPSLGNTAPLMAIAFGGSLLLGLRFWWVPVVLLVASDLLLGIWHGSGGIGGYTLMSIGFYLAVAFAASRVGGRSRRWTALWCGTLFSGILFYLVANTYSWAVWPGYEKSLAGWWQCQTTGLPGINPPAWMFLRNALIADSIWCAIAGAILFFESRWERSRTAVAEGASA